jgi:hypothetical protein
MLYYVVIGLAISEALHNAFFKDSKFLGAGAFWAGNLPKMLLLFALLLTIFRFVHGASMHLGVLHPGKRYKHLVDFVGFFCQASVFYLMALSLEITTLFSCLFAILLVGDTVWLIVIKKGYHKWDKTAKQWLWSNGLIIVALIAVYLLSGWIMNIVGTALILAVAAIATCADYRMNWDFYFPLEEPVKAEKGDTAQLPDV